MYIRLNDSIIPNHGYVKISDLSFASLDCLNTDHQHEGNWISPDGTTVDNSGSVPGFMTTRGPLIVRLLRTSGTPQQGIYQCVVQNDTAVPYAVHVGLYNSGEGKLWRACATRVTDKHTHRTTYYSRRGYQTIGS